MLPLVRRAVRKAALACAALVLLVILVACAIWFALAALVVHLSRDMGQAMAALSAGGIALLAALVVALVAWLVLRSGRGAQAPAARPEARSELEAMASMCEAGASFTTRHPTAAGLAAIAAGVLFGASPGLRRQVGSLVSGLLRPR